MTRHTKLVLAGLALSLLTLTACGAESMPMAPGPFGEDRAPELESPLPDMTGSPSVSSDPGIEVPYDGEAIPMPEVGITEIPVPIPTVSVDVGSEIAQVEADSTTVNT
jgi:hypothetical protein